MDKPWIAYDILIKTPLQNNQMLQKQPQPANYIQTKTVQRKLPQINAYISKPLQMLLFVAKATMATCIHFIRTLTLQHQINPIRDKEKVWCVATLYQFNQF